MQQNNEKAHKGMKDRILERIRREELSMHSHSFFNIKMAALILVLLLALAVSVLLFTFIFFMIRINIDGHLMNMGPRAGFFFAHIFPWHLLILDVILVALAEWLMRGFKFAYRSPTLYLLFALLALGLALGLFIDRGTSFNDRMLEHAHAHRLPPPLNDLYEHAPHQEIFFIHE